MFTLQVSLFVVFCLLSSLFFTAQIYKIIRRAIRKNPGFMYRVALPALFFALVLIIEIISL